MEDVEINFSKNIEVPLIVEAKMAAGHEHFDCHVYRMNKW
jgi:hypothetical protein